MVLVSLPELMKPEMLVEATATCKPAGTRSKMMLRAVRRERMNAGDPNGTGEVRLLLRESDMPIVVKIAGKVKPEGAKGHYYK